MTGRPGDPSYVGEKSTRDELTRVAQVCVECRRCVDLCTTFPTWFDLIERHDDRDAGRLAPAQQDQVVDECFQCGRCVAACPYAPGVHELAVDVPQLMLRAVAMQHAAGHTSRRTRASTWLLTRVGAIGRVVRAPSGTLRRRMAAALSDLSTTRRLSPLARDRFSTWFRRRDRPETGELQRTVTVLPTCLVEHQAPQIGRALVRVAERNGIDCTLSAVGCCGAPWLHSGDLDRFTKIAERNVPILAAEIRRSGDLVVPQPRCHDIVVHEYAAHVGSSDADFVAAHTHDAVGYLMDMHRSDAAALDTEFGGEVPARIVYHASDRRRRGPLISQSAGLLALTGADVTVVDRSAGVGVTWGLRTAHETVSTALAERLAAELDSTGADAVVGDDHLANVAITEQTGATPSHPLEIVARAYGIVDDD